MLRFLVHLFKAAFHQAVEEGLEELGARPDELQALREQRQAVAAERLALADGRSAAALPPPPPRRNHKT